MPEPFVQKANVENAIKNILEHYPLVDGPIRELLQNSDDAGATKQIFVLDRRAHPISQLARPDYIPYQQSPSLIAYNDADFKAEDWESLKNIFDSSKARDSTAIGQFGQGFRCVYHLTDCPQIFSRNILALLNLPQGTTLRMDNPADAKYTSHIAAFRGIPGVPSHALPSSNTNTPTTTMKKKATSAFPPLRPSTSAPPTKPSSSPSPSTATPTAQSSSRNGDSQTKAPKHPSIPGTVIRLPLRTSTSPLSTQRPDPAQIIDLFHKFIQNDLECVLLFLKHVKRIEIWEIDESGVSREICFAELRREAEEGEGEGGEGEGEDKGKDKEAAGSKGYLTWRCEVETRVFRRALVPAPAAPPAPTTPVSPTGTRVVSGGKPRVGPGAGARTATGAAANTGAAASGSKIRAGLGVGTRTATGASANAGRGVAASTSVDAGTSTGPETTTTTVEITKTTWRVLSCPFEDESSKDAISQIPQEHHPEEEMSRRKLNQSIRVAAPLVISTSTSSSSASTTTTTSSSGKSFASAAAVAAPNPTNVGEGASFSATYWRHGRLFSGLPLPLSASKKWPIHVDAKFAIPPSRQYIRSFLEGGFIGEWNTILFTVFIPQAWTFLLLVLAREDRVREIFQYWPPPGDSNDYIPPTSSSGALGAGGTGSATKIRRPQGTLQTVFDCIIVAKLAVWPVYVPVALPSSPLSPRSPPAKSQFPSRPPQTPPPAPAPAPAPPPAPSQIQAPPPPPEFAELGQLKIARDSHFLELRNALAECGIRFTNPPDYFKNLIEGSKIRKFEFLEPENVYKELLRNVSKLQGAISSLPKYASAILGFLLGAQDGVQLLVGLPLLKNVEGYYITLQRLNKSGKQTLHPLLDTYSMPLFKAYDPNAIAVHELPRVIATAIKEQATGVLNVMELTTEKIKEYLASDPRWTSPVPSLPSPDSVQFLARFYTWLKTQPLAPSFFQLPEVRDLYIIPTHLGLRRAQDTVFDAAGVSQALMKCLKVLNVAFLDHTVGPNAKLFLADPTTGVLRKVGDVKGILEGANLGTVTTRAAASVNDPLTTNLGLSCSDWKVLIDHITRSAMAEQLTEEERRKLRSLPIFPILEPPYDTTPTAHPGPVPEGKVIEGVTSVAILPIIEGCIFVDLRGYSTGSFEILRLLDSRIDHARPLGDPELLELGVRNFGSQIPEIQISIVKHVLRHEKSVSRKILDDLWQMDFVVCRDGVARKPGEVVDPTRGGLGDILSTCVDFDEKGVFRAYWPRLESVADKEIVENLQKLPVCPLRTTLDQDLLLKITRWISTTGRGGEAAEVSRKLLKLLATNAAYGNFVGAIPSETKWIITNAGLKARHECRDRSAGYALFDEVYALVDEDISVTDVLREMLGWTEKVSHHDLFEQLDATLKRGGDYGKIREIVKAIGSDELAGEASIKLREMLGERAWVPTKAGGLVRPGNAVFEYAVDEAGFCEVSFSRAAYPKVVQFLKHMGVQDRPTTNAVLARIVELARGGQLAEGQIPTIVKLLEILPADLAGTSGAHIFVPDVKGVLRSIRDLHFNDTGTPSERLPESIKPIAHPLVKDSLARQLGIEPLARQLSKFSGYMGESFASSIRNVLKDYNETQMLIEMLANAVDAGAKHFALILDEMPNSTEHLISPNMVMFQQCPSLLVYNDAEFKEKDWEGVRKIGEGSKRDEENTIGMFGRGALTMFHLTEFPMLVSSGQAMFIDPSMKHLLDLPPDKNHQLMDLSKLQRYYPGHLDFFECLNDLSGVDSEDITSFPRTVFRLPLRGAEHIDHGSPISNTLWSTRDLGERILSPFKSIARECFLFTGLESIQASRRTPEGVLKKLWTFEAKPSPVEREEGIERHMVQITENQGHPQLWAIVSYVVPPDIVENWVFLVKRKNPKVGLAAHIRNEDAGYEDYHQESALFSTMPLTETVGLPVHCSATFVTTSDRRHIRLQLDNDPANQAKYNKWLLEEIIPPVYLHLLEFLLVEYGVLNHHFWPINDKTPADHIIISALYERHLKNSDRRLFQSAYATQRQLTPDEVVILPSRSRIQPIIDFLAPENVAIYGEPLLGRITDDAGLPIVSPRFLREHILGDNERLVTAFSGDDPQFQSDVLEDLLLLFLENDPQQLLNLQLLPLEDGSFATFTEAGRQPTYYLWSHQFLPQRISVNPSRLVKLDFRADILLGKGFNVQELTSASMASLIEEVFPKRSVIEDISQNPRHQQFINDFWDNFLALRLEVQDIVDFPLVPTLTPNRYISLGLCKQGEVSIVPTRFDELPCRCLAALGVPIVLQSAPPCPHPLVDILRIRNEFPEFKLRNMLEGLQGVDPRLLIERFGDLDANDRMLFSEWIRRHLFLDVPDHLTSTARALPVWDGCNRDGRHTYISAENLVLLPEGLVEEIFAPYMTDRQIVIISQEQTPILRSALARLGVHGMSFRELLTIIRPNIPPQMTQTETRQEYRRLIEAILEPMQEQDGLEELLMPDAFDFTLQPLREFYAGEDHFFSHAFGQNSPHFMAPELRDLEGRLVHLKREQDLTMEIFAECVQSIASDSNEEGAAVALDVLIDRMPVRLANLGPEAHRWELIVDIEFIPKKNGVVLRQLGEGNIGLDVSMYVQHAFPDLVTPRVIVREEYIGIAWSQRASPSRRLTEGLIRAYPQLGRPNVEEVIAHLRVLVHQVAVDNPRHPVVVSDLTATYHYLNDKVVEAGVHVQAQLEQLRQERLFLNVDDPSTEWQWDPPETMVFDNRDAGRFRAVRRFLQNYKPLLVAAGAQEVYHPTTHITPNAPTAADPMARVRRKFNEMRRNHELVDVRFIVNEEEPLFAHRSFLAAQNDHFHDLFCTGFSEGSTAASTDEPAEVRVSGNTRACVAFVLDFFYTGEISAAITINLLLEGLRLARYWSIEELAQFIQDCIIERRMLIPETLRSIRQTATEEACPRLQRHCEIYERDNDDYIRRVLGR